jgi:hypothetical protein
MVITLKKPRPNWTNLSKTATAIAVRFLRLTFKNQKRVQVPNEKPDSDKSALYQHETWTSIVYHLSHISM